MFLLSYLDETSSATKSSPGSNNAHKPASRFGCWSTASASILAVIPTSRGLKKPASRSLVSFRHFGHRAAEPICATTVKCYLADGKHLWTGGRNLAAEYFEGDQRPILGRKPWLDLSFDLAGNSSAKRRRSLTLTEFRYGSAGTRASGTHNADRHWQSHTLNWSPAAPTNPTTPLRYRSPAASPRSGGFWR